MKPRDLSKAQRERLAEQCAELLTYLGKLTKRLDAVGMEVTSDLHRAAREAYNAAHRLRVVTMYLAMEEGKTG